MFCLIPKISLGNYSCLKVDLIFTRDRAFYFTTVFIPGIILVTSSFITFWLEWNAVPARSMIGNSHRWFSDFYELPEEPAVKIRTFSHFYTSLSF